MDSVCDVCPGGLLYIVHSDNVYAWVSYSRVSHRRIRLVYEKLPCAMYCMFNMIKVSLNFHSCLTFFIFAFHDDIHKFSTTKRNHTT